MSETRERRLFRSLVELPDGEIDLARAALAIAGEEYPNLEFDRYLNQLDRWAEAVHGVLPGDSLGTLAALIDRLSRVEGFRGAPGAFQDPRASFLSDVLERRTGIPISLALVYMLVGERAGLSMTGVAFPGHFLARCDLRGGFVLLDAFSGGRQLSIGDCELLLQEVHRGALFDPSLVEPAANRAVLFRMLSNLKMLYLKSSDWTRAL